ncbi:XRE family transcriptional regulator [Chitinibacter tainanensis]|uniref:LexA family transcriptional regulator n=1 Tax=Chitinibacter tainanensis TaxID=230667 RepID=UPI002354BADE|nr:XRE family transcriptional regulator [Chitinibacter tainanensis]
MSLLSDRIKLALANKQMSQSALARAAGVSTVAVNGWCTGASKSINGKYLMAASTALGVNPEWLATGKGPMTFSGEESKSEMTYPRTPSEDEYALIPQYSARAACGNGYLNDHVEVTGGLAFKREWLKKFGLNEQNACVIYAHGESMSPKIEDGDVVLLDTSPAQPRMGEIYAVMMDDELIIKRYAKEFGVVMLRGDNPNKAAYPDISVPPGHDLQIVGRVVWRGGGM